MNRSQFLLLLTASLAAAQACTGDPECPAGTRMVGSACELTDEVAVEDDAAVPPLDAGHHAPPDAAPDVATDAGQAPAPCYLDRDHDGVGSGDPVACDEADAAAASDAAVPGPESDAATAAPDDAGLVLPPAIVTLTGDCDDNDPQRAPTLAEFCDGVDNDCDSTVDEDSKNVCGGVCDAFSEHQPGESCSNGLLGSCAREGTYACTAEKELLCSAPPVSASDELCNDKLDNDCDGETDESDAKDAKVWYVDCDGDRFAASTSGSVRACTKPANIGACTWTDVLPQPKEKINWDCNDSKAEYRPGAKWGVPPSGASSWDLDCDGKVTPAPDLHPAVRACSASDVSKLNETSYHCTSAMNNCVLWKGSDGKYRTTPTTKCPDANPHIVRVTLIPNPHGGSPAMLCGVEATGPMWLCR